MLNKEEFFILGNVAKLHGYKGEVSLFLDTTHPEEYTDLKSIFIEIDKALVPFFIQSSSLRDKSFVKVKLEGVDSQEGARKLLRKNIYLPLDKLPKLSGKHFYDFEIEGFQVIDEEFGEVGIVIQVIDFENNPLLQIKGKVDEKEVLLPLANDLVQLVDREKKQVIVKSPPGLIELYLEN